jgi:hypothetical protein
MEKRGITFLRVAMCQLGVQGAPHGVGLEKTNDFDVKHFSPF